MYGSVEHAPHRQQGFTLIEVMVAIILMAIVSLMAWRGLDNVSRTGIHLEHSTEQNTMLLRTLNQLERDIAWRAKLINKNVTNSELLRSSLPPGLSLKRLSDIPLRLDIVRASTEPGAPLQRVRWWRQGRILYRAASPSGDRLPLPALEKQVVVMEDVILFEIRAWLPGKGWTRLPSHGKARANGLEIDLARRTRYGVERYRRVLTLQ